MSEEDCESKSELIDVYEIRVSEELGRYLVAATDLHAKKLIIRETPLVCGPADDDRDELLGVIPMCLGCFAQMNANQESRCTKCGWPVCGVECQNIKHHKENECKFFAENNVTFPPSHTWPIINKSILVLRCFLLKQKEPRSWEEVILKLEPHTPIRQKKLFCVKGDGMILDNMRQFLISSNYIIDEAEIVRISGVINVNAFSTFRSEQKYNRVTIAQCIFSQASLLAHSCIPNATWSVGNSPNFEITIRATVPIKKGDTIAIAYSIQDNMYGTLQRLISTEDVAHFICKCLRCRDKTEFGTYVSAIKCFCCEKGFLLPENPTELDSLWRCSGCSSTQTVQKVVLLLYKIEQEFERIKIQGYSNDKQVEKLEELYSENRNKLLHANHYLLQQISMRIVKLQAFSLQSLNNNHLERFVFHSQFLLSIADVLTPGYCKSRAILQFHLSQGLLMIARNDQINIEAIQNISNFTVGVSLQQLYQLIYELQIEALHYFENCHNYTPSDGLNQHIKCLSRQMKDTKEFLQVHGLS